MSRVGAIVSSEPVAGTRDAATTRRFAIGIPWSVGSMAVYAGTAGWALVFGAFAAGRYEAFLSRRFDLGNMVQAVWSTAHGHPLRMTSGQGAEMIRLAVHVDPILAALAPIWRVWPSPVALLAIQAIALAAGAVPVYWLGRKHLGSAGWGAAVAFVYFFYAPIQWIAINDFHAVTFAVPLLLLAIWLLDEGRLLAFAIVAVPALATKEEIGLALAGLGLWYAIRKGRRLAGLLIVCAGLGWTLFAVEFVIPHFSHGGGSPYFARYAAVGGTPHGFLKLVVSDPGAILAAVTSSHDLVYVALLLGPLLFLWALEPLLAGAALPVLSLNLLSAQESQTSIGYQYVSGIVPFLLAASVLGLGRLGARRPKAMRLAAASLVVSTAIFAVVLGPVSYHGGETVRELRGNHTRAARLAVAHVPDGAAVSATNRIGAHLSARRKIYSFPVLKDARWVVVDDNDPWLASFGERDRPLLFLRFVRALERNSRYVRVFEQDGISVFRLRGAADAGA